MSATGRTESDCDGVSETESKTVPINDVEVMILALCDGKRVSELLLELVREAVHVTDEVAVGV